MINYVVPTRNWRDREFLTFLYLTLLTAKETLKSNTVSNKSANQSHRAELHSESLWRIRVGSVGKKE